MKRIALLIFNFSFLIATQGVAQVSVTGSVQSDMLLPNEDTETGFVKGSPTGYEDNFMTNTYADVALQSKYVDAGVRFEFTQFPLPGYNDMANDFKGWGIPNVYVKGKLKNLEITGGSFYEQFGSGFILRTYEERSLGTCRRALPSARLPIGSHGH